jgi:hypothetical protein
VISLNLVLAGLRLGLKNRQVGEKWCKLSNILDDLVFSGAIKPPLIRIL